LRATYKRLPNKRINPYIPIERGNPISLPINQPLYSKPYTPNIPDKEDSKMGINSTSLVTITLVFLPLLPAILFGFKN
jgi:hypothetical protein